jgi:hypothetical protein
MGYLFSVTLEHMETIILHYTLSTENMPDYGTRMSDHCPGKEQVFGIRPTSES